MPACRTTANHDWAYGVNSMWCLVCWLRKPYSKKDKGSQKAAAPVVVVHRAAQDRVVERPKIEPESRGIPYSRAWQMAERFPECLYCGEQYTDENPPTFDHIVPMSRMGRGTEKVLACLRCNNARGSAPFDKYMGASIEEMAAAIRGNREYRRPKYIMRADGSYVITTASRRQRKEESA